MAGFKEKVKLVFVSYGSRELGAMAARAWRRSQGEREALKEAGINSVFLPVTRHRARVAVLAAQPARIRAAVVRAASVPSRSARHQAAAVAADLAVRSRSDPMTNRVSTRA